MNMTSENCSRRENKSQTRNKVGIYRTTTDYMIRQCQKQKTIAIGISKALLLDRDCSKAFLLDRDYSIAIRDCSKVFLLESDCSKARKRLLDRDRSKAIARGRKCFCSIAIVFLLEGVFARSR